jgi:LuxR family transcriptional regulator, maltose regulon positive regulatory protein
VADRLCGDLADALTGGSDGAGVLARLEREHVFTSASGPTRAWYRYHPLFTELLRAELRYGHAAELPDLHRRAATWHADAGRPVPAVRHALAAGDVDQAAGLLIRAWPSLLADGQAAVLGELVSALPGERVRTSPELAVVAALSRLAMGELEEADAWLGLAAAAEPRFAGPAGGLGAAMGLAGLYRARLVGEVADAGPAARALLAADEAVAVEGSGAGDDQRTLTHALLGTAKLWSGRLEEAAANLEQALADAARTGRQVIVVAATANLALLEALRGRLGRPRPHDPGRPPRRPPGAAGQGGQGQAAGRDRRRAGGGGHARPRRPTPAAGRGGGAGPAPARPGRPRGRRPCPSPGAGRRAGGAAPEPPLVTEAYLLRAVADQELGDHTAAVGWLRRALDLAAPEGYRRVFVEGGAPVRPLLADHLHWDSTHHLLVGALLERLVVPLSEREQVVLRYLSSRLSAGELYVSLNTVKTHIKSIYRKLDTNRRWDAVKRARQLQLL